MGAEVVGRADLVDIRAGDRDERRGASWKETMIQTCRRRAFVAVGLLVQALATPLALTPLLCSPVSAEPAEGAGGAKGEGDKEGDGNDLDTEHIFGFAEGSDIGAKGEREIENITVGSFGKIGSYNQVDTETSFRYSVADRLRLSIGTLTDATTIHDVLGLDNRTAITFSGVIAEARLNIVDDRTHAYGLSLSFNPSARQFDPLSGARQNYTALPLTVLYNAALVPSKLLAAVNLVYTPAFFPAAPGGAGHNDDVAVLADLAYAVTPKVFLGGELRHDTLFQAGLPTAHALFLGPSVFYQLTPAFDVKVAWAIQVPDVAARSLDLGIFERHQVELQFAYGF